MQSPITSFPNGVSSFGIPLIGSGQIPVTMNANYYFVDGKNGGGGDGKTPARAVNTIAEAITICRGRVDWTKTRWAVNDVIVIAPGTYAENLTALPHGCVLIGLGWDNRDAQFGVKIKPASGSPVNVDGLINCAFINIGFESADTSRAFDSTVTNNCLFLNCRFSGAAESVTCTAGFYASDCTCTKWINCDFTCCAVGLDCEYVDSGDKFAHCLIQGCRFTQHTTAAIKMSSNLVGPSSLVYDCFIAGAGQTLLIGISDGSGILDNAKCFIEASTAVSGVRSSNGSYGSGVLLT